MSETLQHIRHYLQRALRRQTTQLPPVPSALFTLNLNKYRLFSQLVIPSTYAESGICTLPWVLVRLDGVFLVEAQSQLICDESRSADLHVQWNTLAQKTKAFTDLLTRAGYDGSVQPILALTQHLPYKPIWDQQLVQVDQPPDWLEKHTFAQMVRKPGFPVAVIRQVQKAMYGPKVLSRLPIHRLLNEPPFWWMRSFMPIPVYSAQRDFAFTPARKPQATMREDHHD